VARENWLEDLVTLGFFVFWLEKPSCLAAVIFRDGIADHTKTSKYRQSRYGYAFRMNLPNKLTLSRLVIAGLFLVVFSWEWPGHNTLALVLFVGASMTDYFDGAIARRRRIITNFGILMDPLADKVLTSSAFIAFVGQGLMPAWMAAVIVARELAITGLRLLAAVQQKVLAAERFGKHKTLSQIVAIIAILVQQSYPEWGPWASWLFKCWVPYFAELSKWVTVSLTLTSGVLYLRRNRELYQKEC
jgi:CDP-diacylglycerol--glycerol-3-phosphate 3-phosphatidyltransferase